MGASCTDRRDEAEETLYRSHLWRGAQGLCREQGVLSWLQGEETTGLRSVAHGPHPQPEEPGIAQLGSWAPP